MAITLNHPIPAEGKIKVQFPKWNPNAPAGQIQPMIVADQLNCAAISGFDDVGACSLVDDDTILFENAITSEKAEGAVLSF